MARRRRRIKTGRKAKLKRRMKPFKRKRKKTKRRVHRTINYKGFTIDHYKKGWGRKGYHYNIFNPDLEWIGRSETFKGAKAIANRK